jgi:hypothetical protein
MLRSALFENLIHVLDLFSLQNSHRSHEYSAQASHVGIGIPWLMADYFTRMGLSSKPAQYAYSCAPVCIPEVEREREPEIGE